MLVCLFWFHIHVKLESTACYCILELSVVDSWRGL